MWKMIKSCMLSYLIFNSFIVHAKPTHLESLKLNHPYGLIGDDYGILNDEDLAVNTCNTSQITPFAEGRNMTYSYWQCFPLSNAHMKCDSLGYDVVEKKEKGYLEIEAYNVQGPNSYLARDAMSMRDCREYLQDWKQKTKAEKYVCISGSYGRLGEIKNGQKEMDWVFDKFKTRKGCESHRSECSLKEVSRDIRQNCIVPKKS